MAVSAYPYIVDLEDPDTDEVEPWIISNKIKGFNCRVYVEADEDWDDEWEYANSIPQFVEITLFIEPVNEGDDPVTLTRMVELPMGVLAKRKNRGTQVDNSRTAGNTDPNAESNTGNNVNQTNAGNSRTGSPGVSFGNGSRNNGSSNRGSSSGSNRNSTPSRGGSPGFPSIGR